MSLRLPLKMSEICPCETPVRSAISTWVSPLSWIISISFAMSISLHYRIYYFNAIAIAIIFCITIAI